MKTVPGSWFHRVSKHTTMSKSGDRNPFSGAKLASPNSYRNSEFVVVHNNDSALFVGGDTCQFPGSVPSDSHGRTTFFESFFPNHKVCGPSFGDEHG